MRVNLAGVKKGDMAMLVKKIKYTDFNGNEREESFYFHYSKAQIIEMQFSFGGGMEEFLKRIVNTQDMNALFQYFKEFILNAVGVKSDDGKRFIKNKEISDSFEQSNAYEVLMMELLGFENPADNANAAADFVLGVLPAEYAKLMQDEANNLPTTN